MVRGAHEQYTGEERFQPDITEQELRHIEEVIGKLHAEKRADPRGVGYAESWSLPDSWLKFMEYGGEVLGLTEDEEEHLSELFKKLLAGRLNDPEEEKSFHELAKLKDRFDKLTIH